MKRLARASLTGDTQVEVTLHVENHRLWDLNDPYLYRVSVRVDAEGVEGSDEASVRCGFRDFRVEKGYFRLNGKRIFVRSSHTGNHCPVGQIVPPAGAPDLLRLDMLYAKASGFNMLRFISGMAHPYQLDLCDEIGLLVYEESLAGWLLADSPQMKKRFELSIREMVLRDRNHPSLAMWGMLNETDDGPVFREAVSALALVRSLDDSRLVLLSSGRWDKQPGIGSVSNPGSSEWEYVWGKERPGAAATRMTKVGGQAQDVGDVHFYPHVPQTPDITHQLRTLGEDSKPVFLSEYGIGSMMDVIHEARMYEQARRPAGHGGLRHREIDGRPSDGGLEAPGHGRRVRVPGVLPARQPGSHGAAPVAGLQRHSLKSQDLRIQPDGYAGPRSDGRRRLEVLARLETRRDGRHARRLGARALVPVCRPDARLCGRDGEAGGGAGQ